VPAPATANVKPGAIADLLARGGDLFVQHWAEVGPHVGRLAMNDLAYLALAQRGQLVVLVAEDEKEALIGYSVAIVGAGMHDHETILCTSDIFFVAKRWRGSTLANRLRAETKRLAFELGAVRMIWHTRRDTAMERCLERWGCVFEEVVYSEAIA
jgi:GNAT superfamily N-acetyltransferase